MDYKWNSQSLLVSLMEFLSAWGRGVSRENSLNVRMVMGRFRAKARSDKALKYITPL
jgi:hypothetical protein